MNIISNFDTLACRADTPVQTLLRRIDEASPNLFQIVLDESGRLLGTVTDGDIRRAMLHGVTFEDTAAQCMQREPKTGVVGATEANRSLLNSLGHFRAFLPLVDAQGIVRQILVATTSPGLGNALVMAGGAGRRLGERTKQTPKPLLSVGDRPILDHVLSSIEAAGFERIMVSVHHLGDQITQFVRERDNKSDISILSEDKPLGTAGALGLVGDDLRSDRLLVVNGDLITRADFRALHDFHVRHFFDGTIAVTRFDLEIPFGVIRYSNDGLFESIEEKPSVSNFVAAGVYYLSPEFLNLVPTGRRMDMPELLNIGKTIGLKMGLFPIHEYWTDVGRPDDLDAANQDIRAGK